MRARPPAPGRVDERDGRQRPWQAANQPRARPASAMAWRIGERGWCEDAALTAADDHEGAQLRRLHQVLGPVPRSFVHADLLTRFDVGEGAGDTSAGSARPANRRPRRGIEAAVMMATVLVLGGGFGGVHAALELEKLLARDPSIEITLVNRDNFFLFTPMLHEVAASDLDFTHIVSPLRKLLRRVRTSSSARSRRSISRRRRVTVAHGRDAHDARAALRPPGPRRSARPRTSTACPASSERALTMKSLGDAMRAAQPPDRAPRRGGHRVRRRRARPAPDVRRRRRRLRRRRDDRAASTTSCATRCASIRAAAPRTSAWCWCTRATSSCPELGRSSGATRSASSSSAASRSARARRCAVCGRRGHAQRRHARSRRTTLVWTAGTSPHPLLATLPCQRDRGRIVVDESLEVAGLAGRVGARRLRAGARPADRRRPPADRAARAARGTRRRRATSPRRFAAARRSAFRFARSASSPPSAGAPASRTSSASRFSGFVAWWLWRTIYLSKLPRFEKKLRVALDWTLDLFFRRTSCSTLTPPPAARMTRAAAAGVEAAARKSA